MNARPRIVIYGSESCGYCGAARMLLKKKGASYEDVLVSSDPALREEMQKRSGRRSVPQVFIDDRAIGGFEELYALDRSGELDRILGIQTTADQATS
ncbi:MAG TPA: glutaredoxin 3 [Woeseiaceae bacterium]|nr:glutaredoxin 3 [Woeseiaceae bacterium]